MSKGRKSPERRAVDAVKDNRDEAAESGSGSSAAVLALAAGSALAPDPEVTERPARRTFTAEFKQRILNEADACTHTGEVGAMLRRHGLYSSHLTSWRKQREAGTLAGLAPRKRGRKATPRHPLTDEVARLERENKRLLARAERAERLVELQKKVAELLGDPLPPAPPELAPEEKPTEAARRRRR